ncbi:MAG: hypothetical protein ACJAUQ_001422 [Maribacter sp.]|jgi:hypothetical protein
MHFNILIKNNKHRLGKTTIIKKIRLLIFTLLLLNTVKAQNGFETQVSLGLPSNSLSKETSPFNAALNLGYMFSKNKRG